MLSEVIKNNEEINRMLIRIMQKRREEGKSFQVSTEDGLVFDEDAKAILENEFKRCIYTYRAEFYPYKGLKPLEKQTVSIEKRKKDFPDCHGGDNGISVTPNMQEGIRVVFDMLNNFSHLINKDNVEKIKNAMNENEYSDYKYVGSTSDQLDFFGYLKSINGTDLDWFISVLPHEAMHAFGIASGNAVMKEGATEEFTREMCENYHIMFSPISHTQEAEFVRKLEMVVGRNKIKEASFYNQELYKFRDESLSEIIKECPDMDIEELQDIFNYTRYKDRSKEEAKTVKEFEEKYPNAFEKIKSLIKGYNQKNYNERYEEIAKEFEDKLNLSQGSFQKYITILQHFYGIAKGDKDNIDIYRDLYTKKFSDLSLPESFNEVEALMNELGNENGFEITSFEDLMRPINDYIKDKTLDVDNKPKDYSELLAHQKEEIEDLKSICIKLGIPVEEKSKQQDSILKEQREIYQGSMEKENNNGNIKMVDISTLSDEELQNTLFHYSLKKDKNSIDSNGLIPKIGRNSKGIDEEKSIFFSKGIEGALETWDVWLKWRSNRLFNPYYQKEYQGIRDSIEKGTASEEEKREYYYKCEQWNKELMSGAYKEDKEKLKFLYEFQMDEMSASNYYALDLIEGEEFSFDEIDESKRKNLSIKDNPEYSTRYKMFAEMYGPYSNFESDKVDKWNMHTILGKQVTVEPERIKQLVLPNGKNDVLSVVQFLYEKYKEITPKEQQVQFDLLDDYMEYVKEKTQDKEYQVFNRNDRIDEASKIAYFHDQKSDVYFQDKADGVNSISDNISNSILNIATNDNQKSRDVQSTQSELKSNYREIEDPIHDIDNNISIDEE